MTDRRGARRGWWIAGITAACVVVAGGVGIPLAVASTTSAQDYRTATVGTGSVSQSLQLAGTVQRVNQVTASFGSSATVTGVDVSVGEDVAAGQKLATEDPTSLKAALLSAQATLAAAQATLAADESGPSDAATGAQRGEPSATGGARAGSTSSAGTAAAGAGPTQVRSAGAGSADATTTAATTGGTGAAGHTGGASASRGGSGTAATPSPATLRALLTTADESLTRVRGDLSAADAACKTVADASGSSSGGSGATTGPPAPHSGGAGPVTPTPTPTPTITPSPAPAAATGSSPTGGSSTEGPSTEGATSGGTTTTGGTTTGGTTTGGTTTGGTTTGGTTTGGTTTGGTTTDVPTAGEISACEQALSTTADALQAVESSVSTILQRLTAVVSAATAPASTGPVKGTTGGAASSAHPSSTSSGAATASTGSETTHTFGGAAGAGTTGASTQGATESTAAREASDEAAILQDQQAVSQAQANLTGATLTAPIAGRIGAITLTVGQTAGTSEGVTIVGTGAATVTVQVPLGAMPSLHAGQKAQVTPAGATSAVSATVQTVSLLPASTSGSTPTYPATVLVPDPTAAMPTGAQASVAITIGQASDAVRIPVSAVAGRTGQSATVTVLDAGVPARTAVALGAIGGGWAQVLSGVHAGQKLVLADASETLPTNTTGGLGGGFAGGGFGGGRFGGAGAANRGGGTTARTGGGTTTGGAGRAG